MKRIKNFLFLVVCTILIISMSPLVSAAPYAYVANQPTGTISILDASTDTVIDTITIANLEQPLGIAFTPDGKKAYVTQGIGKYVYIMDTSTKNVIGKVEVPATDSRGIAITPDGKKAYITNQNEKNITILGTSDNTIIGSIDNLGYSPLGIAITPDGTRAYVTCHGGGILIISIADNTIIGNIPNIVRYYALGIAITPDGKKAYVPDYYDVGKIISMSDNSIIENMCSGAYGINDIAITPDGTKAYLTEWYSNSIAVIDISTNTFIKRIDGINGPSGIKFLPVVAPTPTINSISVPINPVIASNSIEFSASVNYQGSFNALNAEWDWGDGITSTSQVSSDFKTSHVYKSPGIYTVTLTVKDNNGGIVTQKAPDYVVVYDPQGGFVTGGGWINSPAGAYASDKTLTGKASFGFASKYQKGANIPTGNTEFQFKVANLVFKSNSYDWLVVAGSQAKYKGAGTINGEGNYGFMLSAFDGTPDKFRIKIWDKGNDAVIYDNEIGKVGDSEPTTAIGGGSIVIHT